MRFAQPARTSSVRRVRPAPMPGKLGPHADARLLDRVPGSPTRASRPASRAAAELRIRSGRVVRWTAVLLRSRGDISMISQHRSRSGAGGRVSVALVATQFALLFCASAAALPPAAPAAALLGQEVGRLELGAPSESMFVLRGTLPVPPSTFPRADGKQPFGVVDS